MKYFYSLAALAALVAAQLPECANDCIREATEAETDCTFGDWECLCIPSNREAVTGVATSCVIAACGVDVAVGEVVPAITSTCANAGNGGGDDEEETTTTAAPAPEETPEEETPAPSTEAEAEPSSYPEPSEAPEESAPAVPSHVPEPSHPAGNGTAPAPSEIPEAGAAKAGFMGAAAMVVLGAIAL